MHRKDILAEGEFYHLYNRGNSKQPIFLDDEDRDRFVKLLYLCNSTRSLNFRVDIVRAKISAFEWDRGTPLLSIGAWVLMKNHFHLLVSIPDDLPKSDFGKSNISVYMQKLLTSYSKYFNTKYDRVGGLFESNFKSVILDTDEYLKYIYSYIHLNPIKMIDKDWKENGTKNIKKSLKYLDEYYWSSYLDYLNIERLYKNVLDQKNFPNYFENASVFREEIFDWLTYNK